MPLKNVLYIQQNKDNTSIIYFINGIQIKTSESVLEINEKIKFIDSLERKRKKDIYSTINKSTGSLGEPGMPGETVVKVVG